MINHRKYNDYLFTIIFPSVDERLKLNRDRQMTKKIGRGKRHNTFTDFTRSNKLACNEDIDRSKGVSAYMNVYTIFCKYTYENEHKIYL